jgi:hypothetical protein
MQYRCLSCSVILAENNNAMLAVYTLSITSTLHVTEAVCWRKTIHVCAWRSHPPPYHSTPPVLHYFPRKKIMSDTFWTAFVPYLIIHYYIQSLCQQTLRNNTPVLIKFVEFLLQLKTGQWNDIKPIKLGILNSTNTLDSMCSKFGQ